MLFRRWLSYLMDVLIESRQSELNPDLKLYWSSGRYKLVTKGAVYSFEDKYTNFLKAFQLIKTEIPQLQTVLVLGLGIGSIPQMLRQIYHSDAEITAIELDKSIIELYEKYISAKFTKKIQIIHEDGLQFAENHVGQYDLICMDIFVDSKVPSEFLSTSFAENLKKMLSPNGILIFNRLAENEKDEKENEIFFQNIFLPAFPSASILKLEANWMMIGRKDI
ncbi:MAG: fused MFS/spermidine synthase [Saprospiraceae bacterium]|nr:fused MFS/spermidine synthase [Saprospiraceae bacterium]